MYQARGINGGAVHEYRDLDDLAQQFGGDDVKISSDEAYNASTREVHIVRRNPQAGGSDILATVHIDSDDLKEIWRAQAEAEDAGFVEDSW
jgi:hypothetical protein